MKTKRRKVTISELIKADGRVPGGVLVFEKPHAYITFYDADGLTLLELAQCQNDRNLETVARRMSATAIIWRGMHEEE